MIFEILAERDINDKKKFFYDNETNTLSDETGMVYENKEIKRDFSISVPFSKDVPLQKSRNIKKIKIQLGLSCNYSCEYCSQKFVERPPETTKKDIDNFLSMLDNLEFDPNHKLDVEFWGGEPLVYWKTLKPLAEAMREKLSYLGDKLKFGIITNGSILTPEICQWLIDQDFWVGLSHDGPGQSIRGPDPFDVPEKKKVILSLYKTLGPLKRMSFNSMLHSKNQSRRAIRQWFINLTGDPDVRIGEGALVDSYDDDALNISLLTNQDHFDFRINSFNEFYNSKDNFGFITCIGKVRSFIGSVLNHRSAETVGQKCGMDSPSTVAIDLKGNVITCQNVSAVETSLNGEVHLSGHVSNIEEVRIKTGTHWRNRPDCANCPVLHICQGACLFLEGKYWETTCNNSYSDNIVFFAIAFSEITNGYIPVFIYNEHLPDNRRDIWGTILAHTDKVKRKIIPIKAVSEKKKVVNDIEVFEQAKKKEIINE